MSTCTMAVIYHDSTRCEEATTIVLHNLSIHLPHRLLIVFTTKRVLHHNLGVRCQTERQRPRKCAGAEAGVGRGGWAECCQINVLDISPLTIPHYVFVCECGRVSGSHPGDIFISQGGNTDTLSTRICVRFSLWDSSFSRSLAATRRIWITFYVVAICECFAFLVFVSVKETGNVHQETFPLL